MWKLLLLACLLFPACAPMNIPGPDGGMGKTALKFIKIKVLSQKTEETLAIFPSIEGAKAWNRTTIFVTLRVVNEEEVPISGVKVVTSSDDRGNRSAVSDENGFVVFYEPIGGDSSEKGSKYGPVTKNFLLNYLYKARGGGKLRLRFPALKEKPVGVGISSQSPSLKVVSEENITKGSFPTSEDIVYTKGLLKRQKVVKKYLITKNPDSTFVVVSSDEFYRQEDGMKKRGVYLSRSSDFEIYTFVPISDDLAGGKKEICVEQTGRVHAFLQLPLLGKQVVEKEPVVLVKSVFDPRLCFPDPNRGPPEPVLPLKVWGTHGYHNWVVNIHPGNEVKVSYWIVDALGRRVYVPNGEFEINDPYKFEEGDNPFPDPATCLQSYTRIWSSDQCSDGQTGTFSVSVKGYPDIKSLVIPWRNNME